MMARKSDIVKSICNILRLDNKLNESIDHVRTPAGPKGDENTIIYHVAAIITMLFFAAVALCTFLLL